MRAALLISKGLNNQDIISSVVNHQVRMIHHEADMRISEPSGPGKDWFTSKGTRINELMHIDIPPINALLDDCTFNYQMTRKIMTPESVYGAMKQAVATGINVNDPEQLWTIMNVSLILESDTAIIIWDGYDLMPPKAYMVGKEITPMIAMSRPQFKPDYDMSNPNHQAASFLWDMLDNEKESKYVTARGIIDQGPKNAIRSNQVIDVDAIYGKDKSIIDELNQIFGRNKPEEI